MGVFYAERLLKRRYLYPLDYKETIVEYADCYGINRALVFAMVKSESSFNKKAVSSKGAKGLMQITDKTAEYIAKKLGVEEYDLFDEKTNVNFGCYYIKYLYVRFKDIETALVAYNAGEGNVSLWLTNEEYSKDGKTLLNIPFNESREYLQKIKLNFENYKKLYGKLLDKN
jgi:soluble lytic murein transglycosylase